VDDAPRKHAGRGRHRRPVFLTKPGPPGQSPG
jgi:hypothetical protein